MENNSLPVKDAFKNADPNINNKNLLKQLTDN